VHNVLQNLDEPVIFANDVLQGQPGLATQTFARFAVNSTIGFGGIIDVASQGGIPYHSNDFGVTLANWGVPDGPYVMLPVLGPSNVRDTVGRIGDSYADPGNIVAGNYHYVWASVARAATQGIDTRSRNIENLAELQRTSLDYYATLRSLYQQRRVAEIRHEQSNLPNPNPLGGGDSSSGAAMSYTVVPPSPPAGSAR
jgi:phospholipid-binding lipoprotein MlaA